MSASGSDPPGTGIVALIQMEEEPSKGNIFLPVVTMLRCGMSGCRWKKWIYVCEAGCESLDVFKLLLHVVSNLSSGVPLEMPGSHCLHRA